MTRMHYVIHVGKKGHFCTFAFRVEKRACHLLCKMMVAHKMCIFNRKTLVTKTLYKCACEMSKPDNNETN